MLAIDITVPYRLSFDSPGRRDFVIIFSEIVLNADIVVSFRTAYFDHEKGTIVTDPKLIAHRCLRSWAVLLSAKGLGSLPLAPASTQAGARLGSTAPASGAPSGVATASSTCSRTSSTHGPWQWLRRPSSGVGMLSLGSA